LLDHQYNLKIVDFGFASKIEKGKYQENFCGTLGFAAPEIHLEIPYDSEKADIFSAGVILFSMVLG